MKKCVFFFLLDLLLCFAKHRSDRAPPNFVYILTDDQDIMLNGLVSIVFFLTFHNAYLTPELVLNQFVIT